MARWRYMTIDLANLRARTNEIDVLNEAGADGWELICVSCNNIAYLRRVEDPADAPDDRLQRQRGVG